MMFYLIICFFLFFEKLQMSRSSEVENYFYYVQSGVAQSNACILKEFPVNTSKLSASVSALLHCGLHCNVLSQCVGVDIIGDRAQRCRLLYGLPGLIPANTTSNDTIRYQKFTGITIGTDYYCSVQLTNAQIILTICNQGIHQWMIIQRRFDGSENFFRNWTDYENGFGSRESEFWLGNRHIHELINDGYQHLRIEMMDHDCVWKYAEYSTFYVESASFKYRMHVNGYSGNAGDSMSYHNGMLFTTYDDDNDNRWWSNCGSQWRGGWWYNNCHKANLNGEYGNTNTSKGINWYNWKGFDYSMKEVRIMIRKP